MTDVTAGMVGTFGQKYRLDAAFEEFVVECRRRLRRDNWAGTGQRGKSRHAQNRHADESTTRHFNAPSALPGDPDRTSNANFDKLDLARGHRRVFCESASRPLQNSKGGQSRRI